MLTIGWIKLLLGTYVVRGEPGEQVGDAVNAVVADIPDAGQTLGDVGRNLKTEGICLISLIKILYEP